MEPLTDTLANLFTWLLQASWQSALVICMVFLLQAVFRKTLSPAWRYGLWMLVLVRLLLPGTVESAASVFNLANAPAVQRIATRISLDESAKTMLRMAAARAQTQIQPTQPEAVPPMASSAKREHAAPTVAPLVDGAMPEASNPKSLLRPLFVGTWAVTVLFLLVRAGYKNYRFSSCVVRCRPVTHETVIDLLQDCKTEMNVHAPMDVVETPGVESPALLGFVRPRLLLPPAMLKSFPRDKLRYFFLHELAHFKRGDIFVNWLMTALQVLHWFNPLVWLAFSRIRTEREAACDARVMTFCGDRYESVRYGEAIVDLLESAARAHWLPGVVGILEDNKQMKRRITMIAQFKAYPRWTSALAAGLVATLAFVTLTDAQPSTAEQKAEPTAERLIVPGQRVGPYTFDMTFPEVQRRLGRPRKVLQREGYAYHLYRDVSFKVMGDSRQSIEEITVLSPKYKFSNGITVGSGLDAVIAKLGGQYELSEFPTKDFFTYPEHGIMFEVSKKGRSVLEINVRRKQGHTSPYSSERMPRARPVLIAIGGFAGTGKSTMSRRLSRELSIPRLGSDAIGRTVKGVKAIKFSVHPDNPACAAYERLGFRCHELTVGKYL